MAEQPCAACGSKIIAAAATIALFFTSPAFARTWWLAETEQGIRSADVKNGNASLGVTCSLTSTITTSSIGVTLQGKPVTGTIIFSFDQGTRIQADFRNGKMEVGTPENDRDFAAIVKRLKRSTSVAVIAPGGAFRSFSLRGSRRAIGDCPARVANPPAEQIAVSADEKAEALTAGNISIFEVQKRLNLLNYDAGPEDGILSKSTRDASAAFQRDHNRPPTGILTRDGVDLLYKLTDPKQAQAIADVQRDKDADLTTGTATHTPAGQATQETPTPSVAAVIDSEPETATETASGNPNPDTAEANEPIAAAVPTEMPGDPLPPAVSTPEEPAQPEERQNVAVNSPAPAESSGKSDRKPIERSDPVETEQTETVAVTPVPVEALPEPEPAENVEPPKPADPLPADTAAREATPEKTPPASDLAESPEPIEPGHSETTVLTSAPTEPLPAPVQKDDATLTEPQGPAETDIAALTPAPNEPAPETIPPAAPAQSEPEISEPATTAAINPAPDVSSDEPVLEKTGEDGFAYHTLNRCDHERGLVAIHYFLHGDRDKVEVSDLCFDRKNGAFVALESASGLTLFETQNDTDMFEIVAPGAEAFEKTTAFAQRFIPFSDEPAQTGYAGSFGYNPSYNTPNHHKAQSTLMWGFVYGETSKQSQIVDGEFDVHLNASNSWEHEAPEDGEERTGKKPIVLINGRGTFDKGVARLELKTYADRNGIGGGHVDLVVDADGAITGSGQIVMKNPATEVADPHDWKELNWTITKLVGQFVGPEGREFRGIGYISGQTIDQDGFVHEAFGSVGIQGAGTGIARVQGAENASTPSTAAN